MLLLNHPELLQFIFFRIVKLRMDLRTWGLKRKKIDNLYICIDLVNIRYTCIYLKYSHCEDTNFKFKVEIARHE